MKLLDGKNKNFDKHLDRLLNQRKKKISNAISVSKIINEVKIKGDRAVLKYEKKFNKNTKIIPSKNQISKSISLLDDKVKSKNIDQSNQNLVLELIAIDYLKNQKDYEINLIFNDNAYITLTTEAIEVKLEDQSEIK